MSAEADDGSSGGMLSTDPTTTTTTDESTCSWCAIGPPPSGILQIPPPPVPAFLVPDYFPSGALVGSGGMPLDSSSSHSNGSPCRHTCEWRGAEGVHYVEMPQQGNMFDDTWLLVLISSCVGVILIGVVLAAMLIKCKLQPDDVSRHVNDDASQCSSRSNKNSTLSTSTASSSMQTTTTSGTGPCLSSKTIARLQHEAAVLYPCGPATNPEDSRVMWATLTPRGTTRHYLEEHTYETIGNVCTVGGNSPMQPPPPGAYVTTGMLGLGHHPAHQHHQPVPVVQQEHQKRVQLYADHQHHHHHHPSEHVNLKSYNEPAAPSPVVTARPKDEKAFDNTAFVDYEEPHTMKNEYYQLDDVMEPCDPIFSVQGMYGMPPRSSSNSGIPTSNIVVVGGTLRPRVSSPTRIEHPNLPPLNRQPTLPRSKHRTRKNSVNHQQQHPPDCSTTLLRGASSTYIPTI